VTAKDVEVRPISAARANVAIRRWHYSGKVTTNSRVHLGAYLDGRLLGAIQFGPPLDWRKSANLVEGTRREHLIELNRLAFSDELPRNSESRCLAVSLRLLKKHAPQVKWVQTFADATQSGDGAIYRATGFILTLVKPSRDLWRLPSGEVIHSISFHAQRGSTLGKSLRRSAKLPPGASKSSVARAVGAELVPGFQVRYIKFLDPSWRSRLVPEALPYSEIVRRGASMYLGMRPSNGEPVGPPQVGGSSPTRTLQPSGSAK